MNIYVGNLARETSEDEVRSLFESHGKIDTVNLIKDRYTGDSRGFAFVEMPDKAEAQAAISAVDGTEVGGRALIVNEARPRKSGGGGGRRF
ncbi:MAG: RNA-binding protein [Deferribacteres bacterium]|nr:RNA-binding protein [candidate division KSB1 bacterium]MCB9511828.1 RNA-binding protein [Deferribacteres bacterium]